MSKQSKQPPKEGQYIWRDSRTGQFRGVEIIRPAKGPSTTSVAEIRRAIDKSNAAQKEK
jgi:hypothetical protein